MATQGVQFNIPAVCASLVDCLLRSFAYNSVELLLSLWGLCAYSSYSPSVSFVKCVSYGLFPSVWLDILSLSVR